MRFVLVFLSTGDRRPPSNVTRGFQVVALNPGFPVAVCYKEVYARPLPPRNRFSSRCLALPTTLRGPSLALGSFSSRPHAVGIRSEVNRARHPLSINSWITAHLPWRVQDVSRLGTHPGWACKFGVYVIGLKAVGVVRADCFSCRKSSKRVQTGEPHFL